MPNRNKQRGNELETELRNRAQQLGLKAERARGSDGRALGEAEDVDLRIVSTSEQKWLIQAKRRKKLASYLQIPESCNAVCFRQDRGEKLVLLDYDSFLKLLGGELP